MNNNENNNFVQSRTGNPAFSQDFYVNEQALEADAMTVNGTINKTAISLLLLVMAAAFTWKLSAVGYMDLVQALSISSVVAALILGFVIIFRRTSPIIKFLVPVYALLEGTFLGSVSYLFETIFPGVVQMAVRVTLLCITVMLILFKTGVIRVTEQLRAGIIMSTITIAGIYLIDLLLSLFGIRVPMLNATTPVGIGISFVIVAIASFNLLLDFDFVYRASERMLPKYVEWYGAFGLMVSIVWLYVEILKLLAKMRSRR